MVTASFATGGWVENLPSFQAAARAANREWLRRDFDLAKK
jgi:hypothetical protein